MRTSLIGDLMKALENNQARGHKRLRIFELARVFYGESEDEQPLKIAALAYGEYNHPNWANVRREVDFYDLRHDVEFLLAGLGEVKFIVCNNNPIFHGGRCARVELCGKDIGVLGQLHPKYKSQFDLTDLPYVFELDVASVLQANANVVVNPVSKFQKSQRDLAFIMETSINVGDVVDKILDMKIPYLISVNVFDVYYGEKLADTTLNGLPVKSVAVNFLFQANKTLNEDEINLSVSQIQRCVEVNFVAQLRL